MYTNNGPSSHPAFSLADGVARSTADLALLLGRFLLALVFLLTAYHGNPTAGTLANLGVPSPDLLSIVARACEFTFSIALILGVATRYGALLGIVYVIIATALAHLWWNYPQAQQVANYTNFMKNVAIIGGLLTLFAMGAGRISIDQLLARK